MDSPIRTEEEIKKCPSCLSGYFEGDTHTCNLEPYEEREYLFNDLFPVNGMIIRSCCHCNCDVIVPIERTILIECEFCKNKRELEQAERREKKKKQKVIIKSK
jgi:hypothetical protein